jgi:hypothetical protein
MEIIIMTYTTQRQQPVSEQVLAQAELQQYMNQQAQAVAPSNSHFEINRVLTPF